MGEVNHLGHEITKSLDVFFKVLQLLVDHGAKNTLDLTFLKTASNKRQTELLR